MNTETKGYLALERFVFCMPQVKNTVCIYCEIDTCVNGDYMPTELSFARVNGNSANGYEVYHTSCLEALEDRRNEG